jgi:hypothetical protein
MLLLSARSTYTKYLRSLDIVLPAHVKYFEASAAVPSGTTIEF